VGSGSLTRRAITGRLPKRKGALLASHCCES
jgi:hypothetical protein